MSITKIVSGIPVTCTGNGNHGWITASVKFEIAPNTAKTAYIVKVYASINSQGYMEWNGESDLRVTCNGVTKSQQLALSMYSSGPVSSGWDGPVEFSFGSTGITTLTFNVDLDLTRTIGTYGGNGPSHEGDNGNLQHFYLSDLYPNGYAIDVSSEPLGTVPVIKSLLNSNPYNSQDGVSANTNSISLKWTQSGGSDIVSSSYKLDANDWVATSTTTSHTITGLTPGTSYVIQVKGTNASGDSNILTTTIRTKHIAPVVSIAIEKIGLQILTFKWSSDKSLVSGEYKVDNGSWVDINQTGLSGLISIESDINTKHTIYFRGTASDTYDGLISNNANTSSTTYNKATIISIGTDDKCIFGNSIPLVISNPSGRDATLYISVSGNGNSYTFKLEKVASNTTFTPTQDQLDQIYKCYEMSNTIPITFKISVTSELNNAFTSTYEKTLQLTGIAKTVRIGDAEGKPRRAVVWIGDAEGKPRRAVVWVGDTNNKPKRCI